MYILCIQGVLLHFSHAITYVIYVHIFFNFFKKIKYFFIKIKVFKHKYKVYHLENKN